ncbi:MAG: hypothetical protein K6G47_02895 [Clostridia bacterium]|nr:hypothetical protein [Clostridia bacterium]
MDRIDLVEKILKTHDLQYIVKKGFDEYEKADFIYYEVTNGTHKLGIDIAKEYTIFFVDWHAHYSFDIEDEFVRDLNDILDNKMCAACSYLNGRAGAAGNYYAHQLNEEFIEDEFGTGKTVKCYFFDEGLDREFKV